MLIKCPECNKEVSSKAMNCPNCGCPISKGKYKIIINSFDSDISALAGINEVLDFNLEYDNCMSILNKLPTTIVEYDTIEECELYARQLKSSRWGLNIEVLSPEEKSLYIEEKNYIKCPKCNSTNIQIVPRKWSLLTGFMTNKTDRVCVNCKQKF